VISRTIYNVRIQYTYMILELHSASNWPIVLKVGALWEAEL